MPEDMPTTSDECGAEGPLQVEILSTLVPNPQTAQTLMPKPCTLVRSLSSHPGSLSSSCARWGNLNFEVSGCRGLGCGHNGVVRLLGL